MVDARRAKGPQGHTDFVVDHQVGELCPVDQDDALDRSCAYRARTFTVSPTVVSIERSVSKSGWRMRT